MAMLLNTNQRNIATLVVAVLDIKCCSYYIFSLVEAVKHEATAYNHVEPEFESIKAALASGYPLALGIKLYSSFQSTRSDGMVTMIMK